MDVEHLTHRAYKPSLIIALVLSGLVVTFASLLGRGALNLRGSLLLSVPTDVTVIALTEPKLEKDVFISEVQQLREEDAVAGEKPTYTYHVRTTSGSDWFVRLRFDNTKAEWTLERLEKLYGSDSSETPAPEHQ